MTFFHQSISKILIAKKTEENIQRALLQTLSFLLFVLLLFPLALHHKITAALFVFLLGVAMFATIPPLQMQALESSDKAPTLISACNIAAFNLGNAVGAWVGGGGLLWLASVLIIFPYLVLFLVF